jgi:hypothetical protein
MTQEDSQTETGEAILASLVWPDTADVSDLAVDQALAELHRFSLIHLTDETFSVHRLIQAVEQDSLNKEECTSWLKWAIQLFNAFAPSSSFDVRTWSIWLALRPRAEALLKYTQSHGMNAPPVSILANRLAVFLNARADYAQAEPLYRRALVSMKRTSGPTIPTSPSTSATWRHRCRPPTGSRTPNR